MRVCLKQNNYLDIESVYNYLGEELSSEFIIALKSNDPIVKENFIKNLSVIDNDTCESRVTLMQFLFKKSSIRNSVGRKLEKFSEKMEANI